MLVVKFKERAIVDLQIFVRNYENSFLELYKDSGIWSEDEIKNIYIKSAEELYRKIRDGIVKRLKDEKVLGRKENSLMKEVSFFVGNRLIIVLFSDDKKANIRWVESIFIDRKPIIF
ncbi:MAG: hypothetical protein AAB340_02860 [Patescibacteria group bacterium]